MDKDKLVELLNSDLELEFRSIVQYTQHLATVKGIEYQPIAEMIRPHLRQELEHATVLADQIDFLGGVPTTRVPEVPSETDARRAFALDLELEERQLPRALRADPGDGPAGCRRGVAPAARADARSRARSTKRARQVRQ